MKRLETLGSKLIICFISGVLMGLTVAPFFAWFFAWFALAPLWVLVVQENQKLQDRRQKLFFLAPLFWGIGYQGVAIFWITGIHPLTWMGVPWLASLAIAIFCITFISLWGAALVTSWAIGMRGITKISRLPPLACVLIGTSLWCGLEGLWSVGPLWWSSLSYTQSPHNLAILHLGQLSGPSAVTFAIVAVNGLIAEGWINRHRLCLPKVDAKNAKKIPFASSASWRFNQKYLAIATGLFITLHLIGFSLYSLPLNQTPETALKVGIIQGNVPNQIKLYPEGFRRALDGYTTGYLTLVAKGVQAVLTPEGALPFSQNAIKSSSLVEAVREKGVVAWIGGFDRHSNSYTNSLFTFTSDGEIKSRYGKARMVPIGEYVPFEEILGGIVQRLSPLDEHQVPGNPKQLFDTPFGRAIVGICYESAFAEIFRYQAAAGGQFILSPSNDAHFSEPMPAQHHAQDIMRAIETDRWSVRATNTGYSAFIDPHGRTLWISRHNTYETHAETIYKRQTQTLYVRWGDWLTPLLLGLSIFLFCFNIFWRNDGNTNYRQ